MESIQRTGKKNVYLCQVNNKYGNNVFLPYSTGIIMAYCLSVEKIKANYEFKDNFFLKDDAGTVVNKLENPDVFAFSSYIWNYEYNKKLAKAVKDKYPNCLIVFGGHQVPFDSEGYFINHDYVDILVHGDGEIPFSEILLERLSDQPDFSKVSNLSVNLNGKTLKTEIKKGNPDLSIIPSPYLTGVFDEIIKLPYTYTASLETNRGCPYGCAYCDWGSPLMKCNKMSLFDEQRVKDEIEWLGKNKIEFVMGCDSNFGIFPRDNGFVDKLIETKAKYGGFPDKFRTSYAKNSTQAIFDMNQKLNDSKMCKGSTLSFQSLNPKTLQAVGRINMRIDNFKELLQQYNNAGIPTYTEIILGLPHETYETFCDGLNTLLENGQHSSINIYNCEVLPNSMMGDRKFQEMYGIKTAIIPASMVHSVPDPNAVQEYDETVIGMASMPTEEWKKACVFSWAIQCFHCLGLLQYVSILAHLEHNITYSKFYNDLIKFAEDNPNTIIGRELATVKKIIDGVTKGNSWEFVLKRFGDITWTIEEGSFLNIVCEKKNFYNEIKNYLISYLNESEEKINDLLNYADKMIIDPYCKNTMELDLNFDFKNYFMEFYHGSNNPELVKKPHKLIFENTREFNGDLKTYATEIIWYGRKGGRFFHSQDKIKNAFLLNESN